MPHLFEIAWLSGCEEEGEKNPENVQSEKLGLFNKLGDYGHKHYAYQMNIDMYNIVMIFTYPFINTRLLYKQ